MSESSPVIKRAARTYGRPKPPKADSSFDADTSFGQPTLLLDTSSGSLDISEIADAPPSSDFDVSFGSLPDDDDNDASMDGGDILPPSMKFIPIREQLRKLDEELDELDSRGDQSYGSRLEANKATYEPLQSLFGNDSVPERSGASPQHTLTHSTTLKSTQKPSHISSLSHEFSPVASPSPSPITVPGRKKRLPVALDSDSEQEFPQHSSSPHTSPGTFQIHTPPGRSSPTPPTSSEMASRKRKGKEVLKPIPGLELEQRELSEDERPQRRTRSQVKGKSKEKRVKAPTKRDLQETQKTTARLQAQRVATLPRVQQKPLQLTDLMQRVGKVWTHEKPGHQISSDPIEPFSPAPPHVGPSRIAPIIQFSARQSTSRALTPEQKPDTSRGHNVSFEFPLSDDDEELPDAGDIFTAQVREQEAAKRQQELRKLKLRTLEQQQRDAFIANTLDSSSDLEVEETMNTVVKEEAEERRRSKIHNVKTPVRKRKSHIPDNLAPEQQEALLVAAARPSFIRDTRFEKGAKARANKPLDKNGLNRYLLQKAEKERAEIIEQKEREWIERGGKVMTRPDPEERGEKVMKKKLAELVAKGLSRAHRAEAGEEEVEETDEEDDDWTPDVQPQEVEEEEESAQMLIAPDEGDDTEFDDENAPRPKHKHRGMTVVDSDEENAPPSLVPTGRVLVPNSSVVLESPPPRLESSDKENVNIDTEAENETDKENDASLMFDRGEDKENTAIASSQPSIHQPIFGPTLSSRNSFSSLDGADLATSSPRARSPLKVISGLDEDDEDDPFMSTPAPRSNKKAIRSPDFFSPSRRMPNPADDDVGPSSQNDASCSLEPAANIKVGFSQFMATGSSGSDFSPAPALAGSLKTQFSQFVTPAKAGNGFEKLRQAAGAKDFSLTLGPAILPSLDVTDSTRKKAEAIFEKEQDFVVQDAVTKPGKSSQLFLNQHGFYTQTDPSLKTPGEDFSSPVGDSQKTFRQSSPLLQSVLRSKSKSRAPLGTLDLADDEDEIIRPRRLIRRAQTPDMVDGGYRSSPSPSPRNAFDIMKQSRANKPKIPRLRMERSAFVEGEAEESDEDAIFGFGPKVKRDSDEEEDGEDQDATLQELVDDKDMDADTLNQDMVLEKVKEHQELDDAELERIHRDAVSGNLRAKRRDRGIGFEDSDSDDEDDENARRRKKIAKKRRLDGGDSLDQLAKDKSTQAFVESYNAGLPDDDFADFAHLENEDTEVMIPEETQMDEDGEEEDEEEYQPEEVSTWDLKAELRKVAKGETTVQQLDPEDLSWIDNDDMDVEDEPIRIKEVTKRPARATNADQFDFSVGIRTTKPSAGLTQHTKWATKARAEGVSGTGRTTGTTGVTGHAVSTKSKSRTGGGTILGRGSSSGASTSGARGGKKSGGLTKTMSALSAVSGRRDRFGN